jgi:hypothetical protein
MTPLFVFAHGAGLPATSPWMVEWDAHLSTLGTVVRFNYPYMAAGKRRPDRMPRLLEAHRDALGAERARHTGPVFLVGKSMGGRVGCHLSLEEAVDGVICLGYPLCGMGNRATLRDAVLRQMTTPALFVQGTRDRLAPLDLLQPLVAELQTQATLYVLPTGDHSLRITKTHTKQTGRSQRDEDMGALAAIANFVASNQ